MGGRSVLQGPHQELIRIMCSNHTAGVKFTQHDQKPPKIQPNLPLQPNLLTSSHPSAYPSKLIHPYPQGVSQNLNPNILPYLNIKLNPEKYSKPLEIVK